MSDLLILKKGSAPRHQTVDCTDNLLVSLDGWFIIQIITSILVCLGFVRSEYSPQHSIPKHSHGNESVDL
jgi:hypothetical protein